MQRYGFFEVKMHTEEMNPLSRLCSKNIHQPMKTCERGGVRDRENERVPAPALV